MNQKEYKKYLQGPKENRPKNFFYYRNLAEKILGYKRRAGLTIHHLRNTPEQQYFNDNFYERWGIDFDGKMKYCICITTEEHKKLHALSKETKEKISKSVSIAKTKLTPNQRKLNKQKSDNYKKGDPFSFVDFPDALTSIVMFDNYFETYEPQENNNRTIADIFNDSIDRLGEYDFNRSLI